MNGGDKLRRKGVIEILSSVFKLGGSNFNGDRVAMAPASVAIAASDRMPHIAFGVGLSVLSIEVGTPRPEYKIRQDKSSHLFQCHNLTVSQRIRNSLLFRTDNETKIFSGIMPLLDNRMEYPTNRTNRIIRLVHPL